MTSIPTIDKVKKYFPFIHIAWIRTFWVLIFCVIHKGTVNLNKCKKAMPLALEEPTLSLDAAYLSFLSVYWTILLPIVIFLKYLFIEKT